MAPEPRGQNRLRGLPSSSGGQGAAALETPKPILCEPLKHGAAEPHMVSGGQGQRAPDTKAACPAPLGYVPVPLRQALRGGGPRPT